MLRTRENSDIFDSLDEIYLVFTSNKQISSIYLSSKVSVVVLIVYVLCCLHLKYVFIFLDKFGYLSDRLFGNGCSLGLR